MEEVKILLPKLGESIVSARIIQFFKKEGDSIDKDEALLEVSTDKVNSEIPSPVKGTIKKLLVDIDQEIRVGEVLAIVDVNANATEEKAEFFSPAVLQLAKELNLREEDLRKIPHSGRLSRKDVESFAKGCNKEVIGDERKKMSPLRKSIAENMVRSFYTAPHATLMTEVDVTHLLEVIEANKEAFVKKHGCKLSITAFLASVIAEVVPSYPQVNSLVEEDTIVLKKAVHLGVAVHVTDGVMVPVIKDCQKHSLSKIAQELASLAQKARNSSLSPDEMVGGTITLTNYGMTKIPLGIPIIRFPEVAIIGAGAIEKKVVVIEDDKIAVRSMMGLTLTFDHRVFDGIYGCGFLQKLKEVLETKEWKIDQ